MFKISSIPLALNVNDHWLVQSRFQRTVFCPALLKKPTCNKLRN